jgi:adenine-specific DNA-methyltransferase
MKNINEYMPLSHDWNKERLEKLKELFPDLFTNEGRLNTDEIFKLVDNQSVNESERYEFNWFGKSQAKRNAFTPTNATLVFDEKRSVNSTQNANFIIEGENLEVLKLLSGSYREKVKCIYIDPPYNTGKDFVYSDNFTQNRKAYWEEIGITQNGVKIDTNLESDGRYHSNWLNMMYSRLLISRQLLREDGVIFISIDDNEVHHLRKLGDEVFGEDNFVGQIIWQTATDNNPTQIATEHEYVLCYLKDKNTQDFWEIPSEKGKIIQAQYEELRDKLGNDFEQIQTQLRKWLKTQTNDLSGISHYSYVDEIGVFYPGNSANTKPGGYSYDIIHPITQKVCAKPEFGYRWAEKTFWNAHQIGDVLWGNDERTIPKIKKRLNTATQKLKSIYYEDNRATSLELKNLMGGKQVFNNPKSVNFLKYIFRFVTNKNDLILDFFGGSGSTGQAVMELNREDDGNRKFIIIQIPEATDEKSEAFKAGYKKISDITIERNKRVIDKIKGEKKTNNSLNINNLELGFKVFNLMKSNFPRIEFAPDIERTEEENIELLKTYIREKESQMYNDFSKNDIITEILLKNGFELNYRVSETVEIKGKRSDSTNDTSQIIELYTDGTKQIWLCMEEYLLAETVAHFCKNKTVKFICLERALDTTKKYNLKNKMGANFVAF